MAPVAYRTPPGRLRGSVAGTRAGPIDKNADVAFTDSYLEVIPEDLLDRYDFAETHSAAAVLQATSPDEFDNLVHVLRDFELTMPKIAQPGGNKSVIAAELDRAFRVHGFREAKYEQDIETRLVLEPWREAGERARRVRRQTSSTEGHKVDNVKGRTVVDVEWNPKDGNLDRDLANFRSLYTVGQVDCGVIVTRNQENLRPFFKDVVADAKADSHTIENPDVRDKVRKTPDDPLSTTTTANFEKLVKKLARGDDGGCPILAVAITERCYVPPVSVADAYSGTVGVVADDADVENPEDELVGDEQ
jgi:hypothetical protein